MEHAVTVRYHFRLMRVRLSKTTNLYLYNLAFILNTNYPGSTLNKKYIALAYQFMREYAAGKVVKVCKIMSDDNYANPMTKALTSSANHNFFYEFQCK